MKNVFKFLGVFVFLTFISVDAKSQYAGLKIVSGEVCNIECSNSCEYDSGCLEVMIPFYMFKDKFEFNITPSSEFRWVQCRTYDIAGLVYNWYQIPFPAGYSYVSFVSTKSILGFGLVTWY